MLWAWHFCVGRNSPLPGAQEYKAPNSALEVCICTIFIFLDGVAGQERSVEGAMLNRSNEIKSG